MTPPILIAALWLVTLWVLVGPPSLVFAPATLIALGWLWRRRRPADRGPRGFPTRVRQTVLERMGNHCVYCGREVHFRTDCPNGVQLGCNDDYQADHILAYDEGGATVEDNCAVSCAWCNRGKGTRTPDEWMAWLWSDEGRKAWDRRMSAGANAVQMDVPRDRGRARGRR